MKAQRWNAWDGVLNDRNKALRHLDLASQQQVMQSLAWMWSIVVSLTVLSILPFGLTWLALMLIIGGIAMTVAVFKEAERQRSAVPVRSDDFGRASKCVWKLDSEA